MKNSELIENINNVTAIVNRGEKLPVKLSFAITKNLKAMRALYNDYDPERMKLLKEHVEQNEDGTLKKDENDNYIFKPEHVSKWQKEITELLDIDVEFTPYMVSIGNLGEFEISPEDLYNLDFMIED